MCNNRTTDLYISKRAGSDDLTNKITRLITQCILNEQYLGTYVLNIKSSSLMLGRTSVQDS